MLIKIENKIFKIETTTKITNNYFDIINHIYIGTMQYQKIYKTKIYNYVDYNLLICPIIINNKKHIRFILYNLEQQKQYILYQTYTKEDVSIYRKNKDCFIVICKINCISTMHFINIKGNKVLRNSLCLYYLHQVSFLYNYVLTNYSVNIVGNMHNIVAIYNKDGTLFKNVLNVFDNKKIIYNIKDNTIFIKEANTNKVVYTYKIKI